MLSSVFGTRGTVVNKTLKISALTEPAWGAGRHNKQIRKINSVVGSAREERPIEEEDGGPGVGECAT